MEEEEEEEEEGFLTLARQTKPGPRPTPRMIGGKLKEPENMDEYLALKEAALDKWLKKFVVENGLEAVYEAVPDVRFEQVMLKEDLGLTTAEVRRIVQSEVEAFRHLEAAENEVDQRIGKVNDKAGALLRYSGGSHIDKALKERDVAKQMDRLNSGFAEQLSAEYRTARLEFERETQVALLEEQQHELKRKFDGEQPRERQQRSLLHPPIPPSLLLSRSLSLSSSAPPSLSPPLARRCSLPFCR